MGKLTLLIAVAAAALAVAASAAAPAVTVQPSSYGRILFDARGFVLYAFTADARGRSNCTRACARAWPPYLVKREPTAGPGSTRSLVGTTKRRDGTLQATYAGRPLYYYVGD